MLRLYIYLLSTLFLILNISCVAMEDDEAHKVVRILSFEGMQDGKSDFVAACILRHWERELKKAFNRDVPLSECFDVIAGSGMGGITALGLTDEQSPHQKDSPSAAKNIVKLYRKIHIGRIPFVDVIGTRFLEKEIKNISSPHVVVTSFDYDSGKEFIFDNSKKFLVKEAALATSAFPQIASEVSIERKGKRFKFRAAGIHESNPTVQAILKAQKEFPNAKNILVIVLGGQEEQATKNFISGTSHSHKKFSGGSFTYIPIIFNVSANTKHNDIHTLSGIGRRYETDAQVLQVLQFLKDCVLENGFQLVSEIGTEHVQALRLRVKKERTGKLLDLSASDISSGDLPHIIKLLQNNTSLTEINLSGNNIDAFAAQNLQLLIQNSNIKHLILDKNDFGSIGTQPLAKFLAGTSLCYLSLADTNLRDKDMLPLLHLVDALDNLTINLRGIQIRQQKNLTLLKKYAKDKRIINPPNFLSQDSIYSNEQADVTELTRCSLSLKFDPSYRRGYFSSSKKRMEQIKRMSERGIIVDESLNAAGNYVLLRKQMKKKQARLVEEKRYFDDLASSTVSKTPLNPYTQAAIAKFNQSYTDLKNPTSLEQSLQGEEGYSETIFVLNPLRYECVSSCLHPARTNEINNAKKDNIPLHHKLHATANLIRGEKIVERTEKVIWDAFLVESHLRADRLKAEKEELEKEIFRLNNKLSEMMIDAQ